MRYSPKIIPNIKTQSKHQNQESHDVLVLKVNNPFRSNSKEKNKRSEIKISKSQLDLSAQKSYQEQQQDNITSSVLQLSTQKSNKSLRSGQKEVNRNNSKHRLSTGNQSQTNLHNYQVKQNKVAEMRNNHHIKSLNDENYLNQIELMPMQEAQNRMSLDDIIQLAIDKSKAQLSQSNNLNTGVAKKSDIAQVNQNFTDQIIFNHVQSQINQSQNFQQPIQQIPGLYYQSNQASNQNILMPQQNLPNNGQNNLTQSIQQPQFNPLLTNQQSITSSCSQFSLPYFSQQETSAHYPQLQTRDLEEKISEIVEKCLLQRNMQSQEKLSYPPLQINKQQSTNKLMTQSSSVSHLSERSCSSTNINGPSEFEGFKELSNDLVRRMKEMQKSLDDMQISINEKDAEIIRLNMCLGDEKKKNTDLQLSTKWEQTNSTPQRKRSQSRTSIHHGHQNSNSDIVRNMMMMDSPYFKNQQNSQLDSQFSNSRVNGYPIFKQLTDTSTQCIQPKQNSQEIQTDTTSQTNDINLQNLQKKIKKYENMLQSESQANEELTDRVQELERDYFHCKQERDKILKQVKALQEQNSNLEFQLTDRGNQGSKQDEHICLLKKQLEKLSKENLLLKKQAEEANSCNSCIDYIKQMKMFQFKVEDITKEKENQQIQIRELKNLLDSRDEEIREMKDFQFNKRQNSIQGFNMSFQQDKDNEVHKELESYKKRNEMNEMVIEQLKKELEKYAYKLMQIQEKSKQLMQNQNQIQQQQCVSNGVNGLIGGGYGNNNFGVVQEEDDEDGWQ
ncbi:UNKNOWN [Stylonychia lemnae]|uniref:Uncharacterized protein n=1 Tax=Stylonychia lemnae TaxID=5949 RepID=A0A078BAJ5_STYLE|nr:UNKNOWN [Stylonychia lemnae]|eukprot:CDW90588.1 UNKNOWN [Stylonychia lemnae]